jgi:hypothetical protein
MQKFRKKARWRQEKKGKRFFHASLSIHASHGKKGCVLPGKPDASSGLNICSKEKDSCQEKNKKEAKVLVRKSIRKKKKAKEASAMLKKKQKV